MTTIIIVEDHEGCLSDIKKFLESQTEIPCVVHAINPMEKAFWVSPNNAHPDPDKIASAVREKADGNVSILLLDDHVGDDRIGKAVAKQLSGMRIIATTSGRSNYAPECWPGKSSIQDGSGASLLRILKQIRAPQ